MLWTFDQKRESGTTSHFCAQLSSDALAGPATSAERNALLGALTSADAQAGKTVSRTRRRVYGAVVEMEVQRKWRRKRTGTVLLVAILFLALLVPALWSSVETFREGAHFADLQTQTYLLLLMLVPTVIAAATAGYLRRNDRGERGRF